MSFTIADLLALKEIEGIRLLAGNDRRGVVISRTNILDNPDTFDWLSAGELVLSTGYVFREGEELQRSVVRGLADVGCSGLCIKRGRYLTDIPACMIEEAERLQLPLIELPYGYSLSTVTALVGSRILHREEDALGRVLGIHRELMQVSLRLAGIEEVAAMAAEMLGNPVIIVDSRWRLLSSCDLPGNPHPLEAFVGSRRSVPPFPVSFSSSMPGTLEQFRKAVTRKLLVEGGEVTCRVQPIVGGEGAVGFLVVWESMRTMDTLDYIALEQAATIAAIERARTRELEAVRLQSRRDFFDDLLGGNIEARETAHSMAALYGLRLDCSYTCILLKYTEHGANQNLQAIPERIQSACQAAANVIGLGISCIPRTLHVVLLLESGPKKTATRELLDQFCADALEKLRRQGDIPQLALAVGRTVADIADIAESFRGAQQAIGFRRAAPESGPVVFIEDFAVYQLLWEHIDKGTLKVFCRESIGPLLDYDGKNGTQLVETLEQYFALSGNISEAAKRMFIHRNTYIYRLDKIKQVLGNDLQSPHKLLEYQMGLMAMKLLD